MAKQEAPDPVVVFETVAPDMKTAEIFFKRAAKFHLLTFGPITRDEAREAEQPFGHLGPDDKIFSAKVVG